MDCDSEIKIGLTKTAFLAWIVLIVVLRQVDSSYTSAAVCLRGVAAE